MTLIRFTPAKTPFMPEQVKGSFDLADPRLKIFK
jgi:hypothetical protein